MQFLLSDSFAAMFCQVLPLSLLAGVVYLIARRAALKKQNSSFRLSAELLRALFVCYLTGLISLTLVPANFWSSFWYLLLTGLPTGEQFSLFSGDFNLSSALFGILTGKLTAGSWVISMLAGNFLMLVPMGVFLPLVFPRLRGRRILPLALLLPLTLELLQPVVGRSFDVDDLFLNALGLLTGWALAFLLHKCKKDFSRG